jgi:hypothetical protein
MHHHDSKIRVLVAGLAAALAPAGCTLLDDHVQFHDQGKVCLLPEGDQGALVGFAGEPGLPRTYPENRPIDVMVRFPGCLSASCSVDRTAHCSVENMGEGFRIRSFGAYVQKGGTGGCTDDCGSLVARCQTAPLPAGTHRFEHGGQQILLTVPFTGSPPCTPDQK